MIKQFIKRKLLKSKGLTVDKRSSINFNIKLLDDFKYGDIRNSEVHITEMGNGCTISKTISYGDIRLGNFVSINGPGTILHAEDGKIEIGNFCSIAQNVSIQQFNHNIKRPTSYAMEYTFFSHNFSDDCDSKGDIIIGDDVWIGSNVSILSGVRIGRGAVIGAGAVVTKDVEPYSIVGGVPAKKIKMRFPEEKIKKLEKSQWWTWNTEEILKKKKFFLSDV